MGLCFMIFLLFALGLREISAQDETFFSSGLHVLKRWHFKRLLLSPGTNRYGIWGLKQKLCFLSTMQVKWWYLKKNCPKLWAEHSDSADWGMQHTSRDTWWDKRDSSGSCLFIFVCMCRVCDLHGADCSESYLTFQSFMAVSTWKINLWPFSYCCFFFIPFMCVYIRSYLQEQRCFRFEK